MNTKLVAGIAISILLVGITGHPFAFATSIPSYTYSHTHTTNVKISDQWPADLQDKINKALAEAKASIDKSKNSISTGYDCGLGKC